MPPSFTGPFDFYITLDKPASSNRTTIPYEIYQADGTLKTGGEFTMSAGTENHIQLADGDYVLIEGIPGHGGYNVREGELSGYIPAIHKNSAAVSPAGPTYQYGEGDVAGTGRVELLFANRYTPENSDDPNKPDNPGDSGGTDNPGGSGGTDSLGGSGGTDNPGGSGGIDNQEAPEVQTIQETLAVPATREVPAALAAVLPQAPVSQNQTPWALVWQIQVKQE